MSLADSLRAAAAPAAEDTTRLVTRVMGVGFGHPSEQVRSMLEGWHEFYLLAGTAAVTLVGLLFVALSFNLDVLIHESKAHILAYARATLLTFSYVLVVSLMVLIPDQGTGPLGVMLAISSLIVGTIFMRSARRPPGGQPTPFERRMARRGRIYVIGFVVAFLTGVGMVWTRAPQLLFNMISVICMMLGNAMGVSWDLLVEVGKLKAEMAKEADSR